MRSTVNLPAALAASLAMAEAQSSDWWQPVAGTTYAIDLIDTISPPYPANTTAYDGDLFGNNGSAWASLKAANFKTICYFSAGSYENWRPDKDDFAAEDIGEPLEGWPGEWWVNTRSDGIRAIMSKRMDLAVENGCAAVDPDNIDVYNTSGGGGFNLTSDDAVDYIKFLTSEGHKRGLAVGLKNALEIIPAVINDVDFAVNEQCQQYEECSDSQPFIDANKPVLEIEYRDENPSQDTIDSICGAASTKFSVLIKHYNLTAWEIACPIVGANTTTSSSPPAASTYTSSAAINVPRVISYFVLLASGMVLFS